MTRNGSTSEKIVQIYSDGSCHPNPGFGAWACVFKLGKRQKHISGFEIHTTNNRMELLAVIKGLHYLKKPCFISVYTDSKYVQLGITEWINDWEVNGWKNAEGKDVKNRDLWVKLRREEKRHHEVMWNWVRGHSGVPLNELADRLARKAADKGRTELRKRKGFQLSFKM